jgi:hypothetical protein
MDIVLNYWNHLEHWVYESYEKICEMEEGNMGLTNKR